MIGCGYSLKKATTTRLVTKEEGVAEDVFCNECGNFCIQKETRGSREKVWCEITSGKKTWRSRSEVFIGKPEIKNASNRCEDYVAEKKP